MKSFTNFIIFKTNELFTSHVKYKGVGGKELVLDPSFNPAIHVRIYGEVVSVPIRLSSLPISQSHKGLPSYHEQPPFSYKFLSDIKQEIQVGDRIYFHFNTILRAIQPRGSDIVRIDGVHPERTWYIRVRYDQVICAVRNGEIIPIGGNVLVDPDFESWEDISIPVPQIGTDGKPLLNNLGEVIFKPKEQWLVKKQAPTYKYLKGFVRHLGSPLQDDVCEVSPGQKILYHKNADWRVHIEGRDYFVIKQRHILGRWE